MAHTIEWEAKGVRRVFTEAVTLQEIVDANLVFYGDPRFLELEYELLNFAGISDFNLTGEELRRVARMDLEASRQNPKLKVAIVAKTMMGTGLIRMWELSGGGEIWQTQQFADEESAQAWLESA